MIFKYFSSLGITQTQVQACIHWWNYTKPEPCSLFLLCVVKQQIIHPALQPRKKKRTCEKRQLDANNLWKKKKNYFFQLLVYFFQKSSKHCLHTFQIERLSGCSMIIRWLFSSLVKFDKKSYLKILKTLRLKKFWNRRRVILK